MTSLQDRIRDSALLKIIPEELNESYKRQWNYFWGKPIKTRELSAKKYLQRLSVDEQENLLYLVSCLYENDFQAYHCYYPTILAVGTTTYEKKYWQNIERLSKQDKTIKPFAKRKGEDIDLVFVSYPGNIDTTIKRLFKHFDGAIYKKSFSKEQKRIQGKPIGYSYGELADWGVTYFKIPEEYIFGNNTILRHKDSLEIKNVRLQFAKGRDMHIYFHNTEPELKVKQERIDNNTFSILTHHLNYTYLEQQVRKARSMPKFYVEEGLQKIILASKYITTNMMNYASQLVVVGKKDLQTEYERREQLKRLDPENIPF